MTRAEKHAWLSFSAMATILVFFIRTMTDGWQIADRDPADLIWVYIGTVAVMIVAGFIIQIILALTGSPWGVARDERDIAIDAKAKRNGGIAIVLLLNIGLASVLADLARPDFANPIPFDIVSPGGLLLFLFGTMMISTMVERLSAIVYYRF